MQKYTFTRLSLHEDYDSVNLIMLSSIPGVKTQAGTRPFSVAVPSLGN